MRNTARGKKNVTASIATEPDKVNAKPDMKTPEEEMRGYTLEIIADSHATIELIMKYRSEIITDYITKNTGKMGVFGIYEKTFTMMEDKAKNKITIKQK